jgi:hypothetical protein
MNRDRMSWQLRLGIILLVIGLALTISLMGFMDHYSNELGENDADFFLYMSVQVTGNIIFIIGIIIVIIGFLDRYRMIIRPPILSPPQGPGIIPQNNIQTKIKVCGGCGRQIPFDSNLCPYCGVKQEGGEDITLKNGI